VNLFNPLIKKIAIFIYNCVEIYIRTLNEKDFQIEFYKLRFLLVLEMNKSLLELGIGKPKYSKEKI